MQSFTHVCVCVCDRERERVTSKYISYFNLGWCVCMCVCVRGRQGHITAECTAVRNRIFHGLCVCVCVCVCVYVCVCVCVWERERDRVISQRNVQPLEIVLITACVFVCDRERERDRERQGHITAECTARQKSPFSRRVCVCVCVCVCVWERERETGSYHSGMYNR